MQEILKENQNIKSEKYKEMAFLNFKNAKETKFPWNEEIEFKLFEFILAYEQKKEYEELEKQLKEFEEKQNVFNKFNNGCYQQLVIYEARKTSIFFKLKSKIVNFFTLGCYNFEKKLISKIEDQKIILQIQKEQFTKIDWEINNIKKKLSNIEVEIINEQQLIDCNEKFNVISKDKNLIDSQNNNEVVLATNKLIPSSL